MSGLLRRAARLGTGRTCLPWAERVRCGTGTTSASGFVDVDAEGSGYRSPFSLLSVVSRNSSRRTLRAPVILRAVLLRPVDIGSRAVEAAGVPSCAGPEETRVKCREVVAVEGGAGTSTTDGALSERDSELRPPLVGRGDEDGLLL